MEVNIENLRRNYPEYPDVTWDYIIAYDAWYGETVPNSGTILTGDSTVLYATFLSEDNGIRTYVLKQARLDSDEVIGWFQE